MLASCSSCHTPVDLDDEGVEPVDCDKADVWSLAITILGCRLGCVCVCVCVCVHVCVLCVRMCVCECVVLVCAWVVYVYVCVYAMHACEGLRRMRKWLPDRCPCTPECLARLSSMRSPAHC